MMIVTVQNTRTKWCGIYVTEEYGHYWITDDNGGELYVGTQFPTEVQLKQYRDSVI